MYDKQHRVLFENWSAMEGNIEPSGGGPIIDDKSIEIRDIQEVPGSRVEDSEPYEAPRGPTYSSGGEPGNPGFYHLGYTVAVDVVFGLVADDGTGQPIPADANSIQQFMQNDLQNDLSESIIPHVLDQLGSGMQQCTDEPDWGIKVVKVLPENGKVHMHFTCAVFTDEAPEAEYDGQEPEDFYESRIELLKDVGELIKEAKKHI